MTDFEGFIIIEDYTPKIELPADNSLSADAKPEEIKKESTVLNIEDAPFYGIETLAENTGETIPSKKVLNLLFIVLVIRILLLY